MFAAIDPFFYIFLLFALGSAVAEWLKKRRQREELEEWSQEAESQQQPKQATPPRPETTAEVPERKVSWDQELRRLLEGDVPAQAKPEAPPPVVIAQALQEPKPRETTTARQTTVSRERERPFPGARPSSTAGTRPKVKLDPGQQAAQKTMEKVLARKGRRRRRGSTHPLVNWLHNPESVRQAFVASLIFNAPRAESENDTNLPIH